MPTHHLAQLNVARLLRPVHDSAIKGFMDGLDPINAMAEASPGFVWRLQSESGNATDIRVGEDDLLLVNLSVWESVEHFTDFTYRTDHRAYLKRRSEWFELNSQPYMVLWWIPTGHIPTTGEAVARLQLLRDVGPSERAFTAARVFDEATFTALRQDQARAYLRASTSSAWYERPAMVRLSHST